jgi:MoaA/NifB/PqqE/SkfB family radical SAM enzyme
VLHIPTNALAPARIERTTTRILNYMREAGCEAPLTVKPSLDGVGEMHDRIRGVPGNFDRVLETIQRLKPLEDRYPSFHLEVGTVISRANMDAVDEIAAYVHTLDVQSYRNEMAEQRAEFFNQGDPITPSAEEYAALVDRFAQRIRENVGQKRQLAHLTEALRLVYYEYASEILSENYQVLPCYAGLTNAHINPYGQVWPCCVLGYDQPLGDLRDVGYDFRRIWYSEAAQAVRQYIKAGNCACPLANQAYSNILCDPVATGKALLNLIRFRLAG